MFWHAWRDKIAGSDAFESADQQVFRNKAKIGQKGDGQVTGNRNCSVQRTDKKNSIKFYEN